MMQLGTWRGHPLDLVVLCVLHALNALRCLIAVFALTLPDTPTLLFQGFALISGTIILVAWQAGDRWPRAVRIGGVATLIVMTAWFTAVAPTGPGAMASAVALMWIVVHQAVFTPARIARAWLAPAIVGLVVGISVQPAIVGALAVAIIVQLAATFIGAVEAVIRVQQRVQGLTTFDRLTGAANRLGLELAVNHAMAFASRRAELTTLAMIDLDNFKSVNDAHGHLVGDLRLQETVDNWRQALRETDVVSRYGGDEFIVLFPRTDLDTARGLLDRLADVSPVSWTAGLTHVEPGELLEDAIRRADEQMYARRSRERGASA